MNAAVLEQLLQRKPSHLAAYAVEARQQHHARCVIDDEVDSGERLEGADVPALAADDPPLQLVGLELHRRERRLSRVPAGHALHARGEDAPGAAVGVVACLLLHLADQPGALVPEVVLELFQQKLLGLPDAEPRHTLEFAQLGLPVPLGVLAPRLELSRASLAGLLAFLELGDPGVKRGLLRAQALLEACKLFTTSTELAVAPTRRPPARTRATLRG